MLIEECYAVSLHRVLAAHRRGRMMPFVAGFSLQSTRPSLQLRLDDGIQDICLLSTPHNFRGTRWYLRCECGARVFTLYRSLKSSKYRCRRCHALRYRSENLSRLGRLEHRATQLARRIGGTLLREPTRPKGMRHATFLHRRETVDRLNMRALAHRLR